MDTRLKNNKMALRMAAVIVAAAAACFALVAIRSKYHVNNYYMQHDSDFENNDFIKVLFQWNYVLYPEVLEKGGERVSTEELYLSFDEEEVSQVNMDDYYGTELVNQGGGEQLVGGHMGKAQLEHEVDGDLTGTASCHRDPSRGHFWSFSYIRSIHHNMQKINPQNGVLGKESLCRCFLSPYVAFTGPLC